jgi:hypothetical protein
LFGRGTTGLGSAGDAWLERMGWEWTVWHGRLGTARRGLVRRGWTSRDKGKVRSVMSGFVMTWQGTAGMATLVKASIGLAWSDIGTASMVRASQGLARQARSGMAGSSAEWQGTVPL